MQEHLPGWKHLIDPLLSRLEELGGQVHQIKEKFGGLRFYYSFPESVSQEDRRAFFELVDAAERMSSSTCEECGKPGELRNNGRLLLKTLCEKHYDDWTRER